MAENKAVPKLEPALGLSPAAGACSMFVEKNVIDI